MAKYLTRSWPRKAYWSSQLEEIMYCTKAEADQSWGCGRKQKQIEVEQNTKTPIIIYWFIPVLSKSVKALLVLPICQAYFHLLPGIECPGRNNRMLTLTTCWLSQKKQCIVDLNKLSAATHNAFCPLVTCLFHSQCCWGDYSRNISMTRWVLVLIRSQT